MSATAQTAMRRQREAIMMMARCSIAGRGLAPRSPFSRRRHCSSRPSSSIFAAAAVSSSPLLAGAPPHAPVASSQQQPHRSFSNIPTQRQGRERFYVQVGVQPCAAPWESNNNNNKSNKSKKNKKDTTASSESRMSQQASPISAGVDGTDSASCVVRPSATSSTKEGEETSSLVALQKMLRPRAPAQSLLPFFSNGESESELSQDESDSNSNNNNTKVDWFTVTLDGRALRTPMGRPLALPSQDLAWAVAVEWNAVQGAIQPSQMPLMTTACTALDQVAFQPRHYRDQCLRFLQTDTVCYWADPVDNRVLHNKQRQAWNKRLHPWIQNDFCAGVVAPGQVTEGEATALFPRRGNNSKTDGDNLTTGLPHPPALTTACTRWVNSLDAWHLAALHAACAEAKSLLVAAALIAGALDSHQAQAAARVEEEFQIEAWGLVEGQHDYDRLNAAVQLMAAAFVTDALRER